MFGDGLGYFFKCFPVENCYFTVLLQDFILECKGRTGYLGMVDGRWMVMAQGLNMGKAVDGLCLHGYMLDLVWVELEGVPVASGEGRSTAKVQWRREVQETP